MSKETWRASPTTQGHGVFSQYKPDHLKEWIARETRKQERSNSPEKAFNEKLSFHRTSLFVPTDLPGLPIEHRHHAATKTLVELRQYQTLPVTEKHEISYPRDPEIVTAQPLTDKHLPHMSHHHHFGWVPPTPQARIALLDVNHHKDHFYRMGNAQKFNHDIYSKSSLITTRKA
ncbi:hypothetical protein CEUSTIGMA_g4913.t1 [Chlamydomonas eustigma]|uniref:Uncharacterized protein n=1 Tax=Chlamydomonas eustigma TaxID=1157962 RepID=A0A250X3G4_9CHLO|nr:hypothetical protein CEUSTIGMA_g4913.t1 [Chlamydomonas eustigma]|eukprot:GAX77469.1 hypothetical protein CEUSTIGMA_g4913.t1 [Chlamydomonas eustigma]